MLSCSALCAGAAQADLTAEWIANVPVGSTLSSALGGMVVDAAGVSYFTGAATTSNGDVLTAAIGPDGALLWSRTWNGATSGADRGRALALGPGGTLYVTGNTPGPGNFSNVLLLAYDAATGTLLGTRQYSSGPSRSESGNSVTADPLGGVYVCGATTGDGSDAHIMKFDAALALQWSRVWDGPAFDSFSQDSARMVRVDPAGEPVVLVHGVMSSQQPDYVVLKLSPANGTTLWQATWGGNARDSAIDMELDANGDVYVTGTGFDTVTKYSTIKLRGSDGQLLWQAFDSAAIENTAMALALDDRGGVYVTGVVDPDGNASNANDNMFTVKRETTFGGLQWTHLYGQNCTGCNDSAVDVLVDGAGHVLVGGTTSSPPYANDAITFVLDATTGLETGRGVLANTAPWVAQPGAMRFDADQNLFNCGEVYNASTGSVEISVVKYPNLLELAGVAFCSSDAPAADHTTACPCGNAGAPGRGCAHSFDAGGAQLDASGRSADDTVVLRARFMPATAYTLFLQHNARGDTVFHDGVLCASGVLVRLRGRSAAGGVASFPNTAFALDASTTLSQRGGVVVGSGTERYYSAWYRNASTTFCPPGTANLTNGFRTLW